MKKLISYIFPIYNEEGNIDLLYTEMKKVLKKIEKKYDAEIIFINDSSKDNSLEMLISIAKNDSRVKVINFARNFGHQLAVTAGLDHSKGDAVIIMDSDMQDPPEVSLELIKKWEQGFEVVYAQRRSRQDTFLKKLTASIFYRVLDKISDVKIPKDTGDFRLMDRKVVDTLNKFREKDRFLRGMVSSLGFKQTPLLFDRHERHAGKTGYTLKKMIKLAKDGMFGFSSFPIKMISNIVVMIGILFFISLILIILTQIGVMEGFIDVQILTLISLILFVSFLQLFVLAIIGEYILRIFAESIKRPIYIISDIYEKNKK